MKQHYVTASIDMEFVWRWEIGLEWLARIQAWSERSLGVACSLEMIRCRERIRGFECLFEVTPLA